MDWQPKVVCVKCGSVSLRTIYCSSAESEYCVTQQRLGVVGVSRSQPSRSEDRPTSSVRPMICRSANEHPFGGERTSSAVAPA